MLGSHGKGLGTGALVITSRNWLALSGSPSGVSQAPDVKVPQTQKKKKAPTMHKAHSSWGLGARN